MFDFIRRLFGKGTVRIEFSCVKDGKIKQGTVTTSYVGKFDENRCLELFRNEMLAEQGLEIIDARIVSYTSQEFAK